MNLDPSTALAWRFIGPFRGGRAMAVAGHPTREQTFFFGTSGGGVWRTTNSGNTWANITDDFFHRASVGALAIAPSAPNVIYVGMGECGLRSNVSHGDGVWRSDDSGATWRHLGLEGTHNIARVRVHPHNADTVYVAAFGHRFGPNPERGVYRSRDGGASWQQILCVNEHTGAIDLWLDPTSPRVLYAATWQALLQPWGRSSHGAGSGLYKSVDGGDSWQPLHDNAGFPQSSRGRIAVCASPAMPQRVWALVDAERGGVYRSDNGGAAWTWLNDDRNFLVRSWYFTHLVPDPIDADTLYMPGRKLWKSGDAGRTWHQLNTPYVDQHDLWVDARDTRRMIVANDGGAAVSRDGGETWSSIVNQPTAELYHVAADGQFPYRVYTSQQDNSTLSLPSRSDLGPIAQSDWYDVGGGESGFVAVRPDNSNIVFAGDLPGLGITRYDHRTRQLREICPWGELDGATADGGQYRFNWSTPIVLSTHQSHALYVAGNVVWKSDDEGASWQAISPDLTRNERALLQRSGGSPTGENSVANDYCTISSFAESPLTPGVLWAGSDDGLVHLSHDGGVNWFNITPSDTPEWATTFIEASPYDAARAYLSATAHQRDDFRPYIWRTANYGASWQRSDAGIPPNEFVRVVRADPKRPGLLFCGTEAGIYYSRDDGDSWQPLQLNLPHVAVYDLLVHNDDLLVATHGRGLWGIDDLAPLQQFDPQGAELVTLFVPRPAVRLTRQCYGLESLVALYNPFVAANPPAGVVVDYALREAASGPITLELIDGAGVVVSALSSVAPTAEPRPIGAYDYALRGGVARLTGTVAGEEENGVLWGARTLPPEPEATLATDAGFHRAVLPLLYPNARKPPGALSYGITAPVATPGDYSVRLTIGERSYTQPAQILPDPRVDTTPEDYAAQFALMTQIRDAVSSIADAVESINARRRLLDAHVALGHDGADERVALRARLQAIELELVQPALHARSGELAGTELPSKLDHKLEALGYSVARSDNAPTRQMHTLFADLSGRLRRQLAALGAALGEIVGNGGD